MLLLSLLGIVLPFGSLWGPFLCKCELESDRKFRTLLVWLGIANILLSFVISTVLILPEFQKIAEGQFATPSLPWTLWLHPLLTIVIAFGLYLSQSKRS